VIELVDSDAPLVVSESKPKAKKGKKRPSDFEIVRTILQRTHERKLQWLLKDMGEDKDVLVLCSKDENEFTYGSPDIAVGIFEFTDPELKDLVYGYLNKMHGIGDECTRQRVVNIKDQISELSKTKGETIDVEVESNAAGSVWTTKTDINGGVKTSYFTKAIDSLFHMQMVGYWCRVYRPLLTTEDPNHRYYEYRHTDDRTGSIITIPPADDAEHNLNQTYPHGFRAMVTKGLDVIVDKPLVEFPYPVIKEELIVFQNESVSCQIAHRIIAEGWRMVLLRPNAVFFPTLSTPISSIGQHSL
jgi:hypothetical protein